MLHARRHLFPLSTTLLTLIVMGCSSSSSTTPTTVADSGSSDTGTGDGGSGDGGCPVYKLAGTYASVVAALSQDDCQLGVTAADLQGGITVTVEDATQEVTVSRTATSAELGIGKVTCNKGT